MLSVLAKCNLNFMQQGANKLKHQGPTYSSNTIQFMMSTH